MKKKICSNPKCKKPEKLISEFSKDKKSKDGSAYWCKECKSLSDKDYRDKNQENLKIYSKIYYDEHKEKIFKYQKEYNLLNKEKISIRSKEYYLKNCKYIINRNTKYKTIKRKENSQVRIQGNISHRIYLALKNNIKALPTMMLIGCEIDYLMYHIQKQFVDGMSWDNYGDWHIDHVKPCVLFDLSKPIEQRKCFNYKNLQPLWALDNLKKSAKYYES